MGRLHAPHQDLLEDALSRRAVSALVAAAFHALDPNDWAVASALTAVGRQWAQRRPAGHHLLATTRHPR